MQTIMLVTTERVIWYGGWTTSCSSLRTRRVTRYADNCVSHHRKSGMVWGVDHKLLITKDKEGNTVCRQLC